LIYQWNKTFGNERAVVNTSRAAIARIHDDFLEAGLREVADDNNHWKATDKLRLYVDALCNVPLVARQPAISPDENSTYAAIPREKISVIAR
jgi:hypothetical protein